MSEQLKRVDTSLLAKLIEVVGLQSELQSFKDLVFRAVNELAPFQFASMVVYREGGGAHCIHHNFIEAGHLEGLDKYINYTYVLNPVYAAFQKRAISDLEGVVRVADLNLAHPVQPADAAKGLIKAEEEEIGYRTPGWPSEMTEILVLIKLQDGSLCEIGLLKPAALGSFTEFEIASIESAKPVLDALINRHWFAMQSSTPPENNHVDQAFHSFGHDLLTAREQEIAQMILRGHSSISIGLNLGIALPTVKAHRRNIYAKLSIASQSELLAAFLRSVDHQRGII